MEDAKMISVKDEARLWKMIDTHGRNPDVCWEYIGNSWDHDEYGVIKLNGKVVKTHRVVLSIQLGRELGEKELGCHNCHNPACNNPAHLRVADHRSNMRDMVLAGRSLKGSKHPNAKVNEAIVHAIRKEYADGLTFSEIANKLNISYKIAYDVCKGLSWTHI